MRVGPILLLLAMLLSASMAEAAHPVPTDRAALAREGAGIVVFVDVNGAVSGTAEMDQRTGDDIYTYSTTWRGSYAWSATAFLEPLDSADAAGWTHAGQAWANSSIAWDDRGSGVSRHSVGSEYEWQTTAEHTCTGQGIEKRYPRVLARVTDSGTLLVRFESMQWISPSHTRFECRSSDTSSRGTTEHERVGPAALVNAPLLEDGKTREELAHLDLELDVDLPRQTHVGTYSGGGSAPRARDRAYAYCGESAEDTVRRCSAYGTVESHLYVDPCNVVRQGYEKHLADVEALKQPAKGSSEQQVRAFQVDATQKVRALLGDARSLELMCDGAPEAMPAAARAQRMVADAWFDVARTHGLSQRGIQDALAAERGAQLTGSEGSNSLSDLGPSIERNGAPPPSQARATVRVHSPVALHAWDEDGRHVGWNATKGAPDLEVPNATYEGEPGGAQTLDLPAGVYRVSADEIGPGTYSLNLSDGDATEVTPMRSLPGGASSILLLVDHTGATTLAAARGTQPQGFLGAEELRSTASPPGAPSASAGGSQRAGEEGRDAPSAGVALLVVAVAAVALAAGRRRR